MKKLLLSLATITFSFTILNYDAQTNVYARIKNGSIWNDTRRVYTNSMTGEFYEFNFRTNKNVLETKYVPSYEAASKAMKIGDTAVMQRSLNAYRAQ